MWLGTAETARFTAGTEPGVLELDGWRLGLAICKDAGVPQHWADTAALGIDAYLGGSVKAADEAAVQDERARRVATEHADLGRASPAARVRMAAATTRRPAGSGIWAADGSVVAQAGPETGAIARAALRR